MVAAKTAALCAALAVCTQAAAQRGGGAKESSATPAERLYRSMLHSTAKVMFVDSVVVPMAGLQRAIPLPAETARLAFGEASYTYTNGVGDKRYSSDSAAVYTSDLVGGKWTVPERVEPLSRYCTKPGYPFLMADGTTLYFSAESEDGLGGRDIFMTRQDGAGGEFYEPENVGLPYNSPQNEYLMAIDEAAGIGWLVTDRGQEEGYVCVYTFEPTTERFSDGDGTPEETLEAMARISSIADTWGFGDREAALARLSAAAGKAAAKPAFTFVVNDRVTYTSLGDFRLRANAERYSQYLDMVAGIESDEAVLQEMREAYAEAAGAEKAAIGADIIEAEGKIERGKAEAHSMEKAIRNKEIRLMP